MRKRKVGLCKLSNCTIKRIVLVEENVEGGRGKNHGWWVLIRSGMNHHSRKRCREYNDILIHG